MIVDCRGETADVTTRTLLNDRKCSEALERSGEFCGSSHVDAEFINWLCQKVKLTHEDSMAIRQSSECQAYVRKRFWPLKYVFDGKNYDKEISFDLEELRVLKQMVSQPGYRDVKQELEDNDWVLDLDLDSFKAMFDPSVDKIINLIR